MFWGINIYFWVDLAEKFGLPLPPPYLSLKGIFKEEERKAAALSGVNFASGGAGIFNGSDQQFVSYSRP